MLKTVLKNGLKKAFRLTPYDIVKRRNEQGDFDAIDHNSLEAVNSTYSDKKFVKAYVNKAREAFYSDTKELILNAVDPSACRTVGDFGCGVGGFLERLRPEFEHTEMFGYDFSDVTLNEARSAYPRPTYEQYDIYTPPPRRHDLTICSQTLEHLLEPELALKHLIDATEANGLLLLTVPNGRTDTFKGHLQFWSPESWSSWIGRNVKCDHETMVMERGTMGSTNLAALIRP